MFLENFVYKNFDAVENEFYDDERPARYLIRGHLKSGGAQTIAEVITSDFDNPSDAANVAGYIFNLIATDLEKFNSRS